MNRLLPAALLALTLFSAPAWADENPKPDDNVTMTLSAEDWVTTKTARVTANVEAAVNDSNAGSMRTSMTTAIDSLAKAEWRLTSFNRNVDSTGLEHWSASYEARVPENELDGLNDAAKKLSKAGMQLSIANIDFSPTLDEMEAARSALRAKIYKEANDQLTSLNAALPGRNYRIASIDFMGNGFMPGVMQPAAKRGLVAMSSAVSDASAPDAERSEKIMQTAHIVLAAVAPISADVKH